MKRIWLGLVVAAMALTFAWLYYADPVLSQTRLAVLGGAATVVGVVVAAIMIVWQQRDSARTQVVLDRYEKARSALAIAQENVGNFSSFLHFMPIDLGLQLRLIEGGQRAMPIKARFPEYQRLWNDSGMAVAEVLNCVGACEMLVPDAKLLREALACAHDDVYQLATELVPLLVAALPIDYENTVANPGPMPEPLRTQVMGLAAQLHDRLFDLQNYLGDTDVDLSGRLVGNLFGAVPPRRVPPDTRLLVLSTDARDVKRVRNWVKQHPCSRRYRMYIDAAATEAAAARAVEK